MNDSHFRLIICMVSFIMHTTMKTRATITIRPEVLNEAKQLASRSHTSVSSLIESLLEEAARREADPVGALIGSANLKNHTTPDPVRDHLLSKYLRD